MPSPVAHGLAGLTIHVLACRDRNELRDPWRLGVTVGAALAADLDLLFRFVDGRNHHNRELHSIGFAMLAGACGLAVFAFLRWRRPVMAALAVFAAWGTHLLLDYLNVDTSPPIGLLALWPFSTAFYKSPVPIFLDIGRTLSWSTMRHDAVAALWECVVLVPVLVLCWRLRRGLLEGPEWREASTARR